MIAGLFFTQYISGYLFNKDMLEVMYMSRNKLSEMFNDSDKSLDKKLIRVRKQHPEHQNDFETA